MAPMAWPVENGFLLMITALFVLVFAIVVWSMVRHGPEQDEAAGSSSGMMQWFWVLVPFAILLFVTAALAEIHARGERWSPAGGPPVFGPRPAARRGRSHPPRGRGAATGG